MNLLKLKPPASAGLKECTDVGTNLSGAFSGLDSWIQSSMNFVSILIWDICIDILSYILFYEYILFYISSYILIFLRSVNEEVSEYFRFVTFSFPSSRPRPPAPIQTCLLLKTGTYICVFPICISHQLCLCS